MSPSSKVREHIRANVVGYVALFFALSGGVAFATHPGGANTISSGDIIDREVRPADIDLNAVRSGHIASGHVRTPDLGASSVRTGKIANGQVRGPDIASHAVGVSELDPDAFVSADIRDIGFGFEIPQNAIQGFEISNGTVSAADLASTLPAVRASHGTLQGIPDGGLPTKLQFDSEVYDTRSLHAVSGANNSRLVAPTDGVYVITAGVEWQDDGDRDGWRSLFIHRNGLPAHLASSIMAPAPASVTVANSADTHQVVTTQARLNAGDYVELFAFQNSGSAKNILGDSSRDPEFSMAWVAPG